ncbi:MAG: hypothetical protein IPH61_02575 [Bacteroidetes bacterium]|nr:hypothetical protein [Bacteroidota bacterium]
MKSHSIIVLYILIVIHSVSAQELEPRAYANLPKALNAIALGYTYTKGNVILDPSIPISDLEIVSHNVSAGYMRTFSIAGKIARVQIGAPLILMNGDYVYQGADTTGARSGFGDLRTDWYEYN